MLNFYDILLKVLPEAEKRIKNVRLRYSPLVGIDRWRKNWIERQGKVQGVRFSILEKYKQ